MRFKKVNFDKLKLKDGDSISKTYIRLVESDSRLAQFVDKHKNTKSEPSRDCTATHELNQSN